MNIQAKSLNTENIQLRAKNQDIEKQMDSLCDKLQKKEKELNKVIFEKDMQAKTEEELKLLLEDNRKRWEIMLRENNELKNIVEVFKQEKREIMKELKEYELKNEILQKNLKVKEGIIKDLQLAFSNLEKQTEKKEGLTKSNQNIKAQTNKVHIKHLDIPEKRGISDSPERKNFQSSDRADETLYKTILIESMKLLGIQSPKEFYERITHYKQSYSKYKKIKKFIDKISDMIVQCSPSGSFNREPSTHQI